MPVLGFGASQLGEQLSRWHAIGHAVVLIGEATAMRTANPCAAGLRTA
ncbi:MAG: hypothetical protein IPG91_13050 [Ideonella sp.]|nr:hypothetical protein [Ideonella sp.]